MGEGGVLVGLRWLDAGALPPKQFSAVLQENLSWAKAHFVFCGHPVWGGGLTLLQICGFLIFMGLRLLC